ncbi:amidophosphoribosyltransferase [Roseivirga pacifica]|uniref:Amidophosphoribosyltransferase n=1 Tax=Roseivirga pacifica TaxID=1267423 RepID=A0A1I0M3J8_9BACT|nr:amidophosphoribosyltransferase [Roseivirga pacifica]MCO6358601.1 amidophosphoribosyltransferase [Roseivirga pacifica]MCO6365763.1 amidophosphoribosyltransferase [Roseivirga pacifica]MCO6371507.1 amidophosphoribosyltransferase [Roseivirga pacifica]MCO6376382.1 amidophosphoribosyltransferase [Roseivirga pacifica]MCO6378885.1 amidophosphoribosyltransferase [Roseivirga pacifica]
MSEPIKHECGIAHIRLRKPLQYYIDKYGTAKYAVSKLYVMMQKQSNRGQDGVGVANIKIGVEPGKRYISRYRTINQQPVDEIFGKIAKKFEKAKKKSGYNKKDADWLKNNMGFTGEVWLGHLRYGTHGKNSIESCHPFLRQNNWRSRNLVMAGNFNMTNVDELFDLLLKLGQHPKEKTDTVTVMEKIGHFIDEENQRIFDKYNNKKENSEITELIEDEMDLQRVLKRSFKDFDGGYAMVGLLGHGASFVVRDPNGIRPAYKYIDDEVIVVASEKQAIKAAFNVNYDEIDEINPGNALIVHKNGNYEEVVVRKAKELKACSFERIYFSRGNDPEIYQERKMLGKLLVPQILKAINFDLKNTVFSYIPNSAEVSFLGMMQGLDEYLMKKQKEVIIDKKPSLDDIDQMLSFRPRVEKLVIKDAKLRTFIADDSSRDDLVANVYDTTYEVIKKGVDTLVVIDDSIVRGTTLEKSILKMLDKLEPKKIVVVSSAPQIRYPDCYGIDMSKIREFVAFRAMLSLMKERFKENKLDEAYHQVLANVDSKDQPNYVQQLYNEFTYDEVSSKITEIVRPDGLKAELEVIYQTVENLHEACPKNLGDWYFTGDYPTPGGMRVVNKAFVNFMEGKEVRAY